MQSAPLLTDLLKAVSRSFYLTLRVLPATVRTPIGLAYLLARTSDTIADTELLPVTRRLEALQDFRDAIARTASGATTVRFNDLAAAQPEAPGGGTNAEKILLERAPEALALLRTLSPPDQQLVRSVLEIIISGQELDLRRFGHAQASEIAALQTDTELADYTYRVAGCVGEFWTRICRAHVFPKARLDDAALLHDAVRFGQGLQLVNILRDLPRDLRQGRCYLPSERLREVNLAPSDLLEPETISALRPVYDSLLATAESHLAAGWRYTNRLPRTAVRVRLACAWPVLIGAETLRRLRGENPLDAARRVKVTRTQVRQIMTATIVRYPFTRAWQNLFPVQERSLNVPR